MIYKSFDGNTIDLHGGGIDLSFPHHENEIAQSESAYDKTLCNHWFHCAHLRVENKKMSKSFKNLYTLDDLLDKGYSPTAIRYTLISSSYRQPLNFTFDGLRASQSALTKIERFAEALLNKLGQDKDNFNQNYVKAHIIKDHGLLQNAWESLCNNLNTAACLGSIFGLIGSNPVPKMDAEESENLLKSIGTILYALGINLFAETTKDSNIPKAISELAEARWDAKQNKDYAKADKLRKELQSAGWEIKDSSADYEIHPID